MQNERRVLISALLKAEKDGYSNLILDSVLKDAELTDIQKGFVTTAFYGVIERKITIDFVLNQYLKRPIKKAPPMTSTVLRSGAYQILFMDKIPNSAAVDESVKIIKKSKENGNSGLVNAVLRKLASEDNVSVLNDADPSVKYSVENWIFERLKNKYGLKAAEDFLKASLLPPPVFIRINNLKQNAKEQTLNELEQLGASCKETDLENTFEITSVKGIENLKSYKEGCFFVQDFSSQLCAKAVDAKKGERVLDCCAAPGGKTFSVSLNMEDEGEVVALDLHPHRAKLIKKGAERLGLKSVNAFDADATNYLEELGNFDKVLCDVPCSGIGVIRRKPEIKYKKEDECGELLPVQKGILSTASKYVKKGGRLVYSTCTLLKEENEDIVNEFLNNFKEFNLISSKTFLPPCDKGDGFFIAVMERA